MDHYYKPFSTHIDVTKYKYIISIGSKQAKSIMQDLNIYKVSFPFDFINTNPKMFLNSIKNKSYLPELIKNTQANATEIIRRSFNNLYKVLEMDENILFLYIHNGFENKEYYKDLVELETYLTETYKSLPFTIMSVNLQKTYEDTEHIKNYRIETTLQDICKQFVKQILFTTENKINIVTPCYRPDNLPRIMKSMDFTKVNKWYIVYDTSKARSYPRQFLNHPQIIELECNNECPGGNPQRNLGLDHIQDGYVYFLDDDNIIHPRFYDIYNRLDEENIYLFDQAYLKEGAISIRSGNRVRIGSIDTAQFIVPRKLIGDDRWITGARCSDGKFILALCKKDRDCFKHLDIVMCYYNYLTELTEFYGN